MSTFRTLMCAALMVTAGLQPLLAKDKSRAETPAKQLFGAMTLPAVMPAQSYGFYSKGCMAGAVALPKDGPTWQVMRLSRNRRWGNPHLISLIEKISVDARKVGWNGLLVGDIAQPRGGPMLTGHASHQIGLDADIWLTPMPNRKLTNQEREDIAATSMLKGDTLYVDPKVWTPGQLALIKTAATQPQVERVLVHPGIKKMLCDTATGDRSWLSKVRPNWGHNYHMHVRIKCPADSPGCKSQEPVVKGEGCGDALAWWFTDAPWKKPKDPEKPAKPHIVTLSDLPPVCAKVLDAPAPALEADVTYGGG